MKPVRPPAALAPRFRFALQTMDPGRSGRILEIGCGHGILLEQLALLTNGVITGIDRSPKMTSLAVRRNAGMIACGRVRIETCDFGSFRPQRFDLITAVNVSAMVRPSPDEARKLRECLLPEGRLHFTFDAPSASRLETVAESARHSLTPAGFTIRQVQFGSGCVSIEAAVSASG